MNCQAAVVEYRPIEGCPDHRVGDDGSVWKRIVSAEDRRHDKPGHWKRLSFYWTSNHYLRVRLRVNGRIVRHRVHVLVLTAFAGPRPSGLEGCHRDGDKANNALSNLRWDTPEANRQDRLKLTRDDLSDAHAPASRSSENLPK